MEARKLVEELEAALLALPLDERLAVVNDVSGRLGKWLELSEPVASVQWVPGEHVVANEYNPNAVATPEMKLLTLSMKEDGITMPVVTYRESDGATHTVVDGFHRTKVIKNDPEIGGRTRGLVPVTVIDKPLEHRMASTVRHNRARGEHGVEAMSSIVVEMRKAGWTDTKIGKAMGMSADEVLRLQQVTGLAALFVDREFGEAWE